VGAKIDSKDLIMEEFDKIMLINVFKVPLGGFRGQNSGI
jgi:hypothetical protein